jgi:hypothetical protein
LEYKYMRLKSLKDKWVFFRYIFLTDLDGISEHPHPRKNKGIKKII